MASDLKMSRSRSNVDIISNLPSNVLDEILSRMPIIDAGKTSILSRKWRYIWASIPDIVFDDDYSSISSHEEEKTIRNKFINIVDQVLLLHNAPIRKFKLSCLHFEGNDIADRWILNLSKRKSIKEFILDIWKGQRPYKIPTCLYSCEGLTHLELSHCLMKPPSTFKGFENLKSLDLQLITLGQHEFENLIRSCPLLERLILKKIKGLTHFNIDAPNLKSITLIGNVENRQTSGSSTSSNKLLSFFDQLPHIQRLEFLVDSFKYFAVGDVPNMLPHLCAQVNYLSIDINLDHLNQSLAALCLLRSCPNIQELIVESRPEKTCMSNNLIDFWNTAPIFAELRLVKMKNITGRKSEMNFISFILSNSVLLRKMIVESTYVSKRWELLKELLRFPRTSKVAEIIYLDP